MFGFDLWVIKAAIIFIFAAMGLGIFAGHYVGAEWWERWIVGPALFGWCAFVCIVFPVLFLAAMVRVLFL